MDGTAIITIPLFILVLYIALGLFIRRAAYLFELVLAGRASEGRVLTDVPRRTAREVVGVLGQSKLFLRLGPGLSLRGGPTGPESGWRHSSTR